MLDALTLDQIRTFVSVAEHGSFRAAAGKLRRVQSGVSASIANLEAQLGIALFDRSGHRPALTPQGRALLVNARDILLRVDAMRARARGYGEGVELELPLAVDTLFPLPVLGAAVAQLQAVYPSVAVRLDVAPLGGPLQALLERRCVLGLTAGEHFRDPRIALEALGEVSQVAVVAAGHPLARRGRGARVASTELADYVQVVLADPTDLSSGRDFGVISPRTCRVGNQDAKHALIRAGVGWGRLPAWQVEQDIAEGRLVRVRAPSLGRDGAVVSEIYLAHRVNTPLGPAARELAAIFKRLCGA